jgi:hypothetical protein
MVSAAARTVEKQIRELKKWVARPDNKARLFDSPRAELEQYLSGEVVLDLALASRLEFLPMWYGEYGAYRVLQGDNQGWTDIQRAFRFEAFDARLIIAEWDRGRARCVNLFYVCFPWLHAILAKDDPIADWFGKRIVDSFQSMDGMVDGWEDGRLNALCVKLHALWREIDLDRELKLIDVYQRVFDAWNDGTAFAEALHDACDFHVENSVDDDPDGAWDFFRPLYSLFPVEILAIRRIRREQRLPMPEIDHPLMQTPLAHPPDPMPKVEDELLNAVIAKARTELPIGDPW